MFRPLACLTLTSLAFGCAPSATPRPDDSTGATSDSVSARIETHTDTLPGPSPWDDARRRGIEFRAIGQEPGWMLEIDHEKGMHLLADYGSKIVDTPAPPPVRDSSGAVIYDARTDAHRLTVVIRATVCHDTMSGDEMTHTVTVTLDGKEYRGCGRQLGDKRIGG